MEELSSLQDLLDLQVVDSDIDRALDRRAALPELEAYRIADTELAALDEQLGKLGVRVREIDLSSDKSSGELTIDEDKAHREEQRLYAGGLSARDAEHLRDEVAMLRRRISDREDEVLGLMEERDQLAGEIGVLEADRASVAGEKGRLEELIGLAWKEIDAEISRFEEQKTGIIPLLDPELIELYEGLRPTKEGVAVALLGEGVCGGCHLTLSAAEQVQAAKGSPPRCVHCQRILVLR